MTGLSSNSQVYRILVVGRDVSELSAGANLLTQAGYNTDLVVTVDQAVRRAALGRYHLAVVSSTFTHDEQVAIRARLKQAKPVLPTLLLGPEHISPDALKNAVASCLKKKLTVDLNPGVTELQGNGLTD